MSSLFVVIDVGCHECGVSSLVVGTFKTKEEADKVCAETSPTGWRDGGQTIPVVFEIQVPE